MVEEEEEEEEDEEDDDDDAETMTGADDASSDDDEEEKERSASALRRATARERDSTEGRGDMDTSSGGERLMLLYVRLGAGGRDGGVVACRVQGWLQCSAAPVERGRNS